jgi:hypothetical protein
MRAGGFLKKAGSGCLKPVQDRRAVPAHNVCVTGRAGQGGPVSLPSAVSGSGRKQRHRSHQDRNRSPHRTLNIGERPK